VSTIPEPVLKELAAKAAGVHTPRIFVLSAPSGAGKDTAIEGLRQRDPSLSAVVTYTTRARRDGERDGVDYHFVSTEQFAAMRAGSALLEHAEYAGHFYGVPRGPVEEALAQGRDVLLKIDVQGAAMIKLAVPSAILIFLAPPDTSVLERRIRARGDLDDAGVQMRLDAVARELGCIPGYDYLVINRAGRMHETVDQIETVMRAERYRVGVAAVAL
jgi:guanylate kinase